MWKKDIDVIKRLHEELHFQRPLLDVGGLENPCIADYDISAKKAHRVSVQLDGQPRNIVVPHVNQTDRYVNITRPWSFIDSHYRILNPEYGDPGIEDLPKFYSEAFNTVVLVSVLEHVIDPFECSHALFQILRPGGYLFTSVPFMFPIHDTRDNWRFSPEALKTIYIKSGFEHIEGDYHVQYSMNDGIGNLHNPNESQPVLGCFAICRKPVKRSFSMKEIRDEEQHTNVNESISGQLEKERATIPRPALNDLDRKLSKYLDFTEGFFVEAGANDGFKQSNTYYLENALRWKGILIEAIPELYEQCKKQRKNSRVYNYALVAPEFLESTALVHYADLMSVVDGALKNEECQEEHIRAGLACQKISHSYSIEVPVKTLEAIIDEVCPGTIDLLSLDVEGYELNVLKGLNFEKYRPQFILVEARFYDEVNEFLRLYYEQVDQLSHHDYLYRVKPSSEFSIKNGSAFSKKSSMSFPNGASFIPLSHHKKTCVFLNTYYPGFLDSHFSKTSELISCSYQIQKDALQSECFGDSDFYSEAIKKHGWDAQDFIVNCERLQQSWAVEHHVNGQGLQIAVEQIRQLTPDVVYLQDLNLATADFIAAIRPFTKLIVGQIASKVPPQIDLLVFDILFSSFPHFVKEFRKEGITAYYQPLAFDPRVLSEQKFNSKKYEITFVGTLSADHSRRMEFLEDLQGHVPFDCWGYQISPLANNSRMQRQYHGEAWGGEMFTLLQESSMTLNYHVDAAEQFANNMRLFEATGCGALLITDYKDNLQELFDVGREIVAYRSLDECADLIRFYGLHQDEARQIAKAGQARTLRDHTYDIRMAQTAEILERHLNSKFEKSHFSSSDLSRISYGYESIKETEVTTCMTNAWKNSDIPHKQRTLVQTELHAMYSGKPPIVFQVLANCLQPYVRPQSTILEIGCASGYYYEILEYLLGKRLVYTGVDYSEPLISMAKSYYPSPTFHVANGENLPFLDGQFQIAISSCILLHVPEYREHIRETARVAQDYVVAHRTPVCKKTPTQLFKKYAYEIETVELRFHEKEFLEEFYEAGLTLLHAMEYSSSPHVDQYDVTYVFRKTQ